MSAPNEITVERLMGALRRLHSAVDAELMGDTDLPDDDSPLMRAMQEAAILTRPARRSPPTPPETPAP